MASPLTPDPNVPGVVHNASYWMADSNGAIYDFREGDTALGDEASPGTPHGRISFDPSACLPADGNFHDVGFTYLPFHYVRVSTLNADGSTGFVGGLNLTDRSGHGVVAVSLRSDAPPGRYGLRGNGYEFKDDVGTGFVQRC